MLQCSGVCRRTSNAAVVVTSALPVIERRDQRQRDSALPEIDNVTIPRASHPPHSQDTMNCRDYSDENPEDVLHSLDDPGDAGDEDHDNPYQRQGTALPAARISPASILQARASQTSRSPST